MQVPQSVWNLYNKTVADFITSNFGNSCKLIYGFNKIECPNCIFNPITKSSSNIYKAGGPLSFDGEICPYCNGVGYSMTETSEIIKMRTYFNKKDFIQVDGMPLTAVDGTMQTIGFLTDLPKIQQAKELVAFTEIGNYLKLRYVLAAEPIPWGLGPVKNYFIAYWNRNQ